MTADDFRKIALSFREAVESAHMNHPDFRVGGKIFATLGYPDENWAVVKLTPEEQKSFVRAQPDVFQPVKGAWGRRGNTKVHLPTAKAARTREALAAAWSNTAPKRLAGPTKGLIANPRRRGRAT
ncbi:MAG: MmcQ/YjbR family DNA-binding protein [Verrucomicrobiota bacterium]|nr:MmcQ/YjbR family DNA-binding protein [Verrucomicrobiota bacterium]